MSAQSKISPASMTKTVRALEQLGPGQHRMKAIQAAAGLSHVTAGKALHALMSAGQVIRIGRGGYTHYRSVTAGPVPEPVSMPVPPPPRPAKRARRTVRATPTTPTVKPKKSPVPKSDTPAVGITDDRLLAAAAQPVTPFALAKTFRVDQEWMEQELIRLAAERRVVRTRNPVRGYGEHPYVYVASLRLS